MQLIKKFLHALNIGVQCRSLNVGLWSCPQFLFLIMGTIIISVIIITYFIGQQYADIEIVALIITFVTVFLFIISFIIVRAFEQVVKSRELESKQAKEILQLKDQFVFIAAHELRTPANAIKWGLSSLRTEQPVLAKESDNLLSIIERGNDRLLRLVEDMLEVSRIESHTIVIKLEKVSIVNLIPEVETELQSLADKQGVELKFEIGDNLPVVRGDTTRLKEVFLELITSTLKYSNKGDTIAVSSDVTDTAVTFYVEANNMVFTEEDRGHVFEKFPQSSAVNAPENTGLGLFIVRQLIELMSGTIRCVSDPKSGTIFSFSLERADIAETPKKPRK